MSPVVTDSDTIICGCGKEYKHRSSFYRHKKICQFIEDQEAESNIEANIETNTLEIINSLLQDKPIKPKSFRNRTSTAPEKNRSVINGEKNA